MTLNVQSPTPLLSPISVARCLDALTSVTKYLFSQNAFVLHHNGVKEYYLGTVNCLLLFHCKEHPVTLDNMNCDRVYRYRILIQTSKRSTAIVAVYVTWTRQLMSDTRTCPSVSDLSKYSTLRLK